MNTLVAGLIDIAIRLGRWIVRRLAKWALSHVVGYMLGKVDDMKRRIARAKTDRRRKWLRGRVARWTKAAKWIEANALKKLGEAAKEACKLPAFAKLPEVARCERMVAA